MAASTSSAADSPLPHATVVFVGHHGSGKSTTAAHVVIKLGGLDKRSLERVERETNNYPASRYAWVLDRLRLERERAMTIDLKLCRVVVPPPTALSASVGVALTLVDTPGHPDHLRNAIAGITQADVAVLVVDSRPAVLEAPASSAQTRDLAQLAANLANHRTLVVAVNHLDVAYESDVAEQRFTDASAAVTRLLRRREGIIFVPVSGFAGDNLVEPSPRLPWWKGATLVGAITAAVAATPGVARSTAGATAGMTSPALELPLRIPLIGIYKVGGIGTVPAGRLAGGCLRRGAATLISPHGIAADVKSLESFHDSLTTAVAGDVVGVAVKGVPASRLRRGYVLSDAADRPARLAASFTAKVQVLRDPTSKREGRSRNMRLGYCALVHVHTAQVPCRLRSIKRFNMKGEVVEGCAQVLMEGDIAEVVLVPLRSLVVETFKEYPHMGRFAVRASLRTEWRGTQVVTQVIVAVGRIEAVTHVGSEVVQPEPAGQGAVLQPREQPAGTGGEAAAPDPVSASTDEPVTTIVIDISSNGEEAVVATDVQA